MSYYPTPDEYIVLFIRCVVELFLISGFLYWCYFKTPWRHWLKSCPPLGRAFAVFIVVWSAVHLLDRFQYNYPAPYSFFPLTRFAMYQIGHPKEFQVTYEIVAHAADGTTVQLDPTSAFYTIGLPSINTRFQTLRRSLHSDKEERRVWAEDQLRRFFNSFRRHPDYPDDLIGFDFIEHYFSLEADDLSVPVKSNTLYRWRMAS